MDATFASDEALIEAVGHFFNDRKNFRFEKASGGVNNRVYHVFFPDQNERYVLRIYNNGANTARVRYEHRVLKAVEQALQNKQEVFFQTPRLLKKKDSDLTFAPLTHASLEPGTEACCFQFIEGTLPSVKNESTSYSAGRATALLVEHMRVLHPLHEGDQLPNPLFRDVYAACPGRTLAHEDVEKTMRSALFADVANDVEYLLSELQRVARIAQTIKLPEQQIHADLHLDNVLVKADGTVSAVLDFEFSAWDWRVMELCVGLTKYIGSSGIDIRAMVKQFVEGYLSVETNEPLTKEEIAFVADGMVLRIVANVVFFAGRATASPPQDKIETLVNKVVPYANRCRWIEQNKQFILDLFEKKN